MSASETSLALARQYRPRLFQALVGQEHVTQALSNALITGRLHHAYLFTGTRGVGKTTVSRILAKALNCVGPDGQGGVTAQPCGVCNACRDIDAGRFVDYVELDAASNRGVEEISQLLDQAVYKPVVGRTKVYMIDEVHMLSTHAFNAMLKTLEEPPDYLKFVLATTDPQKVPVTVLSRCLQFNLRPLPPALVAEHLAAVLDQEQIAHEAGALRLLGRAARGSMRDALSLTDQAIAFGNGQVLEQQVQQMLGATPRAHVLQLIEALLRGDAAAMVAEVDALRAAGHAAQGAADEMARWLQLVALAQAAPNALDPQDPDTADALQLAPRLPADELQLAYRIALQAREELPLSPDEHSGLLMLVLRMLAFRPAGAAAAQPPAPASAALRAPSPPSVQVPVPVAAQPRRIEPVAPVSPATPLRPLAPRTSPPVSPPVVPPAPSPATKAAAAPLAALSLADADDSPPWLDLPPEEVDAEAATPPLEVREPAPIELSAAPVAVVAAAPETTLQATPEGEAWALLVQELEVVGLARTLAMQSQALQVDRGPEAWAIRLRCASPALGQGTAKLQAALQQRAGVEVRLALETGPAHDTPLLREQAAVTARQRGAEAELEQSTELALLREFFPTTRVLAGSVKPRP
jgi:DNA polymerase-3 subunit gamma/tau